MGYEAEANERGEWHASPFADRCGFVRRRQALEKESAFVVAVVGQAGEGVSARLAVFHPLADHPTTTIWKPGVPPLEKAQSTRRIRWIRV
jgi:hypothetical protein